MVGSGSISQPEDFTSRRPLETGCGFEAGAGEVKSEGRIDPLPGGFTGAGLEPGFYINARKGGESVVPPPAGVTTDQFLCFFDMPGQPMVLMAHSSPIASGATVLTSAQACSRGVALKDIRGYFLGTYGKDPSVWYGMDTEFKLDQPENDPNGAPISS